MLLGGKAVAQSETLGKDGETGTDSELGAHAPFARRADLRPQRWIADQLDQRVG